MRERLIVVAVTALITSLICWVWYRPDTTGYDRNRPGSAGINPEATGIYRNPPGRIETEIVLQYRVRTALSCDGIPRPPGWLFERECRDLWWRIAELNVAPVEGRETDTLANALHNCYVYARLRGLGQSAPDEQGSNYCWWLLEQLQSRERGKPAARDEAK